jgi:hypothetical protein
VNARLARLAALVFCLAAVCVALTVLITGNGTWAVTW